MPRHLLSGRVTSTYSSSPSNDAHYPTSSNSAEGPVVVQGVDPADPFDPINRPTHPWSGAGSRRTRFDLLGHL
jgi:hypothetical protein